MLGAAEAIGFHATSLLKQRLDPDAPPRTFGFVLQKQSHDFYQALAAALTNAARNPPGVRGRAVVEFAADLTPAAITAMLANVGARSDAGRVDPSNASLGCASNVTHFFRSRL